MERFIGVKWARCFIVRISLLERCWRFLQDSERWWVWRDLQKVDERLESEGNRVLLPIAIVVLSYANCIDIALAGVALEIYYHCMW